MINCPGRLKKSYANKSYREYLAEKVKNKF
jgi:hypothetical protein